MPRHISIAKNDTIQYIEQTQISPLISKGTAKVFYLGENRNDTCITMEVGEEMGRKLPGSPVVGYYREDLKDFEEHSSELKITQDGYEFLDLTKPYGFVPTDSRIWWQDFFDDDGVTRKYLCCEVYLWTAAYPEAQKVITDGSGQSMELKSDSIKGFWTNSTNRNGRIFIINEALIEKLCILGDNFEPCFEGAQIQKEFSLQFGEEIKSLKASMFSLMTEVQNALKEGGASMKFTTCAVEIGDSLWCAIYSFLKGINTDNFTYCLRGVYEDGEQKFAVLENSTDNKLYRLNFSWDANTLKVDDNKQEINSDYINGEFSFSIDDNLTYKEKEKVDDEDNSNKEDTSKSDNKTEDADNSGDKDTDEDEDKNKKKYSLDEIPEYAELNQKYAMLMQKNQELENQIADLTAKNTELSKFKLDVERIKKQEMIDGFFMLSDADKADVVKNIDEYSLDDIEAKLSVICYRNKVSFSTPSSEESEQVPTPTTFSLNGLQDNDDAPEWVKMVRLVQAKEN